MVKIFGISHKLMKFPAGELHVKIDTTNTKALRHGVVLDVKLRTSDDIMELLLVSNALNHCFSKVNELRIGYLPYGRQDRIAVTGECFSLEVMAALINTIDASKVVIKDPHSDVIGALIKNFAPVHQHFIFKNYLMPAVVGDKADLFLISPDGGALKKIHQLAKEINCLGVVECSKIRDVQTGAISGVRVHSDDLQGKNCYIVDDICDGGRTFVEIAKALRKRNCGKITLMVTHGLFTKGLGVFEGIIDNIIVPDSNLPGVGN